MWKTFVHSTYSDATIQMASHNKQSIDWNSIPIRGIYNLSKVVIETFIVFKVLCIYNIVHYKKTITEFLESI